MDSRALVVTAVENGRAGRSKMGVIGGVGLPHSVGVPRLIRKDSPANGTSVTDCELMGGS